MNTHMCENIGGSSMVPESILAHSTMRGGGEGGEGARILTTWQLNINELHQWSNMSKIKPTWKIQTAEQSCAPSLHDKCTEKAVAQQGESSDQAEIIWWAANTDLMHSVKGGSWAILRTRIAEWVFDHWHQDSIMFDLRIFRVAWLSKDWLVIHITDGQILYCMRHQLRL